MSTAFNTKLFDGTVILSINKSKLGVTRKGDITKVECDADKEALGLSKRILEADEYQDILDQFTELDKWVKSRCVPSPLKNLHLVKVDMVPTFDRKLSEFRDNLRDKFVPPFVAVYRGLVEAAQTTLRTQWKLKDYPGAWVDKEGVIQVDQELITKMFALRYNWLTIGVPESLPESIQREEREKIQAQFKQTEELILCALREGFSKLIDHAIDVLTPNGDGKPKKFYKTTITNITEFIDTFSARNLMDDTALKALVEKAEAVLSVVDIKELDRFKDNSMLKTAVNDQFTMIQSELDKLIVERPSRKFDFDN